MLCLLPRRAPYSDWCAQVERMCERLTGQPCKLARSNRLLVSCYEVGLSAKEMADDLSH